MKPLIIYGGSFDPVHLDHVRIARAASLRYQGEVLFLPNARPRWKNPDARKEDRLSMLRLCLEKEGDFPYCIDTIEMDEGEGTIYTVDTLKRLREKHPDRHLYFILGADSVATFPSWKDPEGIADLSTLIAVGRAGEEPDEGIVAHFHMEKLEARTLGSSSSAVRGFQCYDISKEVRDYISKNRLYYAKTIFERTGEKRYIHSVSVAELSSRIAHNAGLDENRAYAVGLVHDIAKGEAEGELKKAMESTFPQYIDYPEWTFHQFVGGMLTKELFGWKDGEMIEAVERHATGGPDLRPLAKIVYSADKIEPGRGYDSAFMIEACLEDFEKGFRLVLKENMKYLDEKGWSIDNPLTEAAVKQYL